MTYVPLSSEISLVVVVVWRISRGGNRGQESIVQVQTSLHTTTCTTDTT